MELITKEISEALNSLSIPADTFRLLSDVETEKIYKKLLSSFVSGADRKWWWESFSQPEFVLSLTDEKAFKNITSLVPNPEEVVWFVAEEDQLPFYPIYEACSSDIQKVIGECYGFEYYIASKKMDWMLCENHHNNFIGVGDAVIQNMKLRKNA